MTSSREDFSFPTEISATNSAIDSPPLWRSSPAASTATRESRRQEDHHTTSKEDQEEEDEEKRHAAGRVLSTKRADLDQRSFSCIQTSERKAAKRVDDRGGDDGGDGGEEKMDLLWESFDDDPARSRSSRLDGDRQIVEVGCVQAMKKSRDRNGHSAHENKPAMAMVLKLLKKLFLIHSHSHHHHHRRHDKLRPSHAW